MFGSMFLPWSLDDSLARGSVQRLENFTRHRFVCQLFDHMGGADLLRSLVLESHLTLANPSNACKRMHAGSVSSSKAYSEFG